MFPLLIASEPMNDTSLMDVLSYGKESGFLNECSFNSLKGSDWQPRTGRALY